MLRSQPGRERLLIMPQCALVRFPTLPVPLHAPPPRLSHLWLFHRPRRLAAAQMCLCARENGWTGRLNLPVPFLPPSPEVLIGNEGPAAPSSLSPMSVPALLLEGCCPLRAMLLQLPGVDVLGTSLAAPARGRWVGVRGCLCCQDGAPNHLCAASSSSSPPSEVTELGGEALGEGRTLFDPSRKQPGGFEALLMPPCPRESPALSPRLFGAQGWAWRGAACGCGRTDVSLPDKAELAPGVQMESMCFFSTAGCPSHPRLRGNAFLLFAAPRLCTPQTIPSPAPTELLGPSTISCSRRGLQWTLFAALLLQAICPSCRRDLF